MFGKFFGKSDKNQSEENHFQGGWNEEEGVYYAKGSFDNEVEYNNEIICILNVVQDNMEVMNEAMDDKDYHRAEQVRLAWSANTQAYIDEINQLGDYEGDDLLRKAAIKYFEDLRKLMENGYKTLIEYRLAGKRGSDVEQAQLKANNQLLQEMSDRFNEKSEEFLEKYGDYDYDDDEDDDYGYDNAGFTNPYMNMQHDPNNPLLQPIHGISLQDYAAAAANAANGMSDEEICKRLGVDRPLWDEANQLWVKRMQQDTSFTVMSLYGQYFGQAATHPSFSKKAEDSVIGSEDNLTKLATDESFYYELCGARQAAYDAGLDGAQWIQDNFGISLGDFQSVAMKWMMNMTNIQQKLAYQEKKQKEYAQKFAQEMGGGIADDIDF